MTHTALYHDHLETLDRMLTDALDRAGRAGLHLDGVLFHAGREAYYHRDDQPVVFRSVAHFLRYVPLMGPEHCVLARPGKKPLVIRYAPKDYWYEIAPLADSYWQSEVELVEVDSFAAIAERIGSPSRLAYVGDSPQAAAELGIAPEHIEPDALMAPLAWHRGTKTAHELRLLREAAKRGALGHAAARDAFLEGLNEREIYWRFLAATNQMGGEVPFEPIVALGEKISILHYQNRRGPESVPAKTFMLDAGASFEGYASDITRTWAHEDADPLYRSLLASLDALERDLVAMVTPGRPYAEIHVETHRRTALLLAETGLVTVSAEDALAKGLTRTFLPHGIGHHLGLQVHDLGGHQADVNGGTAPPPEEYPFLRNTRTLEPGHVVTIEPGLYFCDVLLDELRARPEAEFVDWALIDKLRPYGGMRLEDDVVCTEDGPEDYSRPEIPGPRGM